jgi:hypothetical protein
MTRRPDRHNQYAECRTLGHAWDSIPVTKRPAFGVAIDLRCTRCYTIRRDIVRPMDGMLLQRSYKRPDDYATERHSRDWWRAEYLDLIPASNRVAGATPDRPAEETVRRIRRRKEAA